MACIWTLGMVDSFYHKTVHHQEIQAVKKATTVLSNLLSHFPRSEFENAVRKHGSDKGVRVLSSFDLFKTLLYGQITSAFSVREIESSLSAHASTLYHNGMKPVSRSTLCDALEKRSPAVFEDTFQALVARARMVAGNAKKRFKNPLRIIDASTIELCLARFDWAKFRSTKGAVKVHLRLDGDHFFPDQVQMTSGAVHEVKQMAGLSRESGNIYVMDRGYVDFKKLYGINLAGSIFVTRMKENCQYDQTKPRWFSAKEPVRFDQEIRLSSENGAKDYPEVLRRITYHDDETGKDYAFMTNDLDRPAQEIADIYKARWQVELFFKWIKQNLKIKTFWGTSQNAVFTQIWVALIVFMLLWISKVVDALQASPQRILQLLKTSLLIRRSIADLLLRPSPPGGPDPCQLTLQGLRN
jgi:Transposase DDE domain/Domain of unknown function (DUF4372)